MLLFRANHIHHLQHIPPNLNPHVVGSALLEYAQGTVEWDGVVSAFVDGWAKEAAASK